MSPSEIDRLQAYLRKTFGSERIRIVPPPRRGLSIEFAIDNETIGTVHRDEEDNEVSYSIHLTVLEEDLPAVKPAPASRPTASRR
jgi:hypothetical protein